MSRMMSSDQRSPNISTEALSGQPERRLGADFFDIVVFDDKLSLAFSKLRMIPSFSVELGTHADRRSPSNGAHRPNPRTGGRVAIVQRDHAGDFRLMKPACPSSGGQRRVGGNRSFLFFRDRGGLARLGVLGERDGGAQCGTGVG